MSIIIEGINKREFAELLLSKGFMDVAGINNFFGHKIKDIPPHRLIDADALISDLQYDIILDEEYSHDIGVPCSDEDKKLYQSDKDVKQNCIEFIKAAPTIIEAEGVKE